MGQNANGTSAFLGLLSQQHYKLGIPLRNLYLMDYKLVHKSL